MTKEDKKIMNAIMGRMLSHEIDNQRRWLAKSIEGCDNEPEIIERFTRERENIIRIISEYMAENGYEYNPLAYMSYEG